MFTATMAASTGPHSSTPTTIGVLPVHPAVLTHCRGAAVLTVGVPAYPAVFTIGVSTHPAVFTVGMPAHPTELNVTQQYSL